MINGKRYSYEEVSGDALTKAKIYKQQMEYLKAKRDNSENDGRDCKFDWNDRLLRLNPKSTNSKARLKPLKQGIRI